MDISAYVNVSTNIGKKYIPIIGKRLFSRCLTLTSHTVRYNYPTKKSIREAVVTCRGRKQVINGSRSIASAVDVMVDCTEELVNAGVPRRRRWVVTAQSVESVHSGKYPLASRHPKFFARNGVDNNCMLNTTPHHRLRALRVEGVRRAVDFTLRSYTHQEQTEVTFVDRPEDCGIFVEKWTKRNGRFNDLYCKYHVRVQSPVMNRGTGVESGLVPLQGYDGLMLDAGRARNRISDIREGLFEQHQFNLNGSIYGVSYSNMSPYLPIQNPYSVLLSATPRPDLARRGEVVLSAVYATQGQSEPRVVRGYALMSPVFASAEKKNFNVYENTIDPKLTWLRFGESLRVLRGMATKQWRHKKIEHLKHQAKHNVRGMFDLDDERSRDNIEREIIDSITTPNYTRNLRVFNAWFGDIVYDALKYEPPYEPPHKHHTKKGGLK